MNHLKSIIQICLFLFLFFSCAEIQDDVLNHSIKQQEYLVSLTEAYDIATNESVIKKTLMGNINTFKSSKSKKVKAITPVNDKNGNATFFIINYIDGGFIVLSADKRTEPILAFSEKNTFDTEKSNYPQGLTDWLNGTKNRILKVREENKPQKENIKKQWLILPSRKAPDPTEDPVIDDPNDPDCETIYTQIGPLLTTEWNQAGHFNNAIGDYDCLYDIHGNPQAGCVAVAVAQVMKFHESPNYYNWSNMPNYTSTIDSEMLIADVGQAVNTEYGCDGSSASDLNIAPALKNTFGYASAIWSNFSISIVEGELKASRPVILIGQNNSAGYAHAWVCDGYIKASYCSGSSYPTVFHMNWGEVNGLYNGFYSINDWTPGPNFYNDNRRMISRIFP